MNFFTYRIKDLPEKMPSSFEETLRNQGLPGEAVFLGSQILDHFVWKHSDLNIYPAGGKTIELSETKDHFFFLNCNGSVPEIIKKREGIQAVLKKKSDGCSLIRFVKKNLEHFNISASSMISSFKVTSSFRKKEVSFENGMFVTGPKVWQRVYINRKKFSGIYREAVSAHPVGDRGKQLSVTVPAVSFPVEKIFFEGGISDSGRFSGGAPVSVAVFQNDKNMKIEVEDKWKKKELRGFSSDAPIEIVIKSEKSGKRHFHFDVIYLVENPYG
ncbi:MAG: hypothetical protein R6W70_03710 [bacterium]